MMLENHGRCANIVKSRNALKGMAELAVFSFLVSILNVWLIQWVVFVLKDTDDGRLIVASK